ncbi:hypothetical protein GOBAR_AA04393 [Gossypium barbadense]|uniref:Uncharacterized protein n=1 Tax=Gossypium barbadense TaxID=3634 RepID=A0A2P5YKS0_GOSBA|nr:hypothetical protein GOBAR_AA04393 [Gossypium barbadense]
MLISSEAECSLLLLNQQARSNQPVVNSLYSPNKTILVFEECKAQQGIHPERPELHHDPFLQLVVLDNTVPGVGEDIERGVPHNPLVKAWNTYCGVVRRKENASGGHYDGFSAISVGQLQLLGNFDVLFPMANSRMATLFQWNSGPSAIKYQMPEDPAKIITSSVPPSYSVKIKEAGAPPSSYQGELQCPK